ncbi:MAG: MOSC domain-containing protein, partial [Bacteroidota bacterium]
LDARLVYMDQATQRDLDPRYAKAGETVSFADGYPYLITNEASRTALAEHYGAPLDMLRFRPNIVVTGAEAYAEDEWTQMTLNGLSFRVPKPCARCIITTIDPATGEKDPRVFRQLMKHRMRDKKIVFGLNACYEGAPGNTLSVGDTVSTQPAT